MPEVTEKLPKYALDRRQLNTLENFDSSWLSDVNLYPSYHGGRCCGITHISGFPDSVDKVLKAYTPDDKNKAVWLGRGDRGQHVWSATNCMNEARPKETALERFRAIVEYFKKKGKGLLEVVLIDEEPLCGDCGCSEDERCEGEDSQVEIWGEHLLAAGFEKGPNFYNSNSGNELQVYYLKY